MVAYIFQHAHFIPIVGVGKRSRQHSFETTLTFFGPVAADTRQLLLLLLLFKEKSERT